MEEGPCFNKGPSAYKNQTAPKPLRRIIHVILEGPAPGEISQLARRRYVRSIHLINLSQEKQMPRDPNIFERLDLLMVQLPHFDANVIMENIRGAMVRKLLVDNGSSCDVLSLEAFARIRMDPKNLRLWRAYGVPR